MGGNEIRRQISDKRIEQYLDIYYSGKYKSTYDFLRDHDDITPSTFWGYLKRHGLESLQHDSRKYVFDFDYFCTIDTEEKAYWLGFVQCDGHITSKTLDVSLCANDKRHLQKLCAALHYEGQIKDKIIAHRYKACRLVISSVRFVKPFVDIGLDKFRSNTMELLLKHNDDLFIHYIRGIIDANAYVNAEPYVNGGNNFKLQCYLSSGSSLFVEQFINEWGNYCHEDNLITINKKGNAFACVMKKRACSILFENAYRNCSISLDRKQEKINAVLYRTIENV